MNDTLYQWFAAAPARYWFVALPFAALLLGAALQPRRATFEGTTLVVELGEAS